MSFSKILTRAVDKLYIKPLHRIMPLQTFRYGVCGGANLVLNWLLYALLYDVVLRFDYFDLGAVYISRHIAAFVITFPITFLTGYWLQSRISFSGSPLREATQLIRYALCVAGSLLLNYGGLKLFVEICGIYAPAAQIITSLITVVYSYLVQKHFTFRGSRQ
ncbi:MAG: GtrA family protein [Tidjanibacter sp.]|nr:GtrA family protein [Tidjanibacter sp.]